MSDRSLSITEIEIERYRGVSSLKIPVNTFNSGINLLFGPNGSGKSTLAQAIRYLLWPEDDPTVQINGAWKLGKNSWQTRCSGEIHTYSSEGEERERPLQLNAGWKDRYYLALHELLVEDDKQLLRQIKDEIHGGVNLDTIKERMGLNPKIPSPNSKEIACAKQAEKEIRKVSSEQKGLLEEEKKLKQLQELEMNLAEQNRKNQRLEKVIALKKAGQEKKELEEQLKEYHPALKQFTQSDTEQYLKRKKRRDTLIEHGELIDDAPTKEVLQLLEESLFTLKKLHYQIEQYEEECAAQQRKEEAARKLANTTLESDQLVELDAEGMEHFKEWQEILAQLLSHQHHDTLFCQLERQDPFQITKLHIFFGAAHLIALSSLLYFFPLYAIAPFISGAFVLTAFWTQHKQQQKRFSAFIQTHKEANTLKIEQLEEVLKDFREKKFPAYPLPQDLSNPSLLLLFEKLSSWQKIFCESQAALGKLRFTEKKYQETFDRFKSSIQPYYLVQDLSEATSCYKQLLKRLEKQKEYRQICEEMEAIRQNISEKEFLQMIPQKKAFDALISTYEPLKKYIARLNQEITLDPAEVSLSLIELEDLLNKREEVEQELQEARRTITAIQTRVKLAKEGQNLTEAIHKRDEAYSGVQQLYEKTCTQVIGDKLINYLIQRSTKHASKVLKQARKLFSLITKSRFEMMIGETFKARDTITNRIFLLDQLSSGTRIQLLLAVRIAFIEVQEGENPKLPLLLDEVLGNSDDERTAAIIDALLILAEQGRQIFYFTAQSDEINRWMGHLKEQTQVPYRDPITLPLHEPTPSWDPTKPTTPKIPKPNELSYTEYGKLLQVPKLEKTPPLEVHLWHLLEETETLYHLLKIGYEKWGQLHSYVSQHGVDSLKNLGVRDAEKIYERAEALIKSLTKAQELARLGKGEAVDEIILRNSGCISKEYLQQVIKLNLECEGSAKELLNKLEGKAIPRYRKNKIDELKQFLSDSSCYDPREPLTQEEIKQRLDAYVAEQNFLVRGVMTVDDLHKVSSTIEWE